MSTHSLIDRIANGRTDLVFDFVEQGNAVDAVDAGGVATGPMANTFLLALALGVAASVSGRDPVLYGLGLVSLIALAPVMSIMALGVLIRRKARGREN